MFYGAANRAEECSPGAKGKCFFDGLETLESHSGLFHCSLLFLTVQCLERLSCSGIETLRL